VVRGSDSAVVASFLVESLIGQGLTCQACRAQVSKTSRFCSACGAPLNAEPAADRRRKLVTLLSCDIAGSTALGGRIDAESLRDVMLTYYGQMRTAIERHGGTVEKFVGDAVMAVFGVPTAHEDDALRAGRAALEMRLLLGTLNVRLADQFGVELGIRIGLATGEVVADDASSRETFVAGDAANLAARLQQAAPPNEILIDDQTNRLVRHTSLCEAVEPLRVKGKLEKVLAHRLISIDRLEATRSAGQLHPLVGREAEFKLLHGEYAKAVFNRRCRLITVVGEAGLGKSRLGAEFVASLPETTVVSGRCLAYGEGITYSALEEIVRGVASIREDASTEDARAQVATVVEGEEHAALIAQRIGQLLGVEGGATTADELRWSVRRFLESSARVSPLAIIVEDLHHAELALLDLLVEVARAADAPIFFFCLARPELRTLRSDWGITFELQPLGVHAGADLIRSMLDGGEVEPGVTEQVLGAAQGSPLFVEELVDALKEAGLLRLDRGCWGLTGEIDALPVPVSITALLGARLDRLPSLSRRLIDRASIEGELFHRGAVNALADPPDRELVDEALASLVADVLVLPAVSRFARDQGFRFRHGLIRDVAYGGVTKRTRASLHARYADWLAEVATTVPGEYDDLVGYHLEQAHRLQLELGPGGPEARALAGRAAGHLIRASARAFTLDDERGAAGLLDRARLLLAPGNPLRLRLLPDLALALRWSGDMGRAGELLEEAIASARVVGDRRVEHLALIAEADLRSMIDPSFQSAELTKTVERAEHVFAELGDELGLARSALLLTWINFMGSRYGPAAHAARRAIDHARRAGDVREEARALALYVWTATLGPMPTAEALRECDELLAQSGGSRLVAAMVARCRAHLLAMQGSISEARSTLASAVATFEDLGRQPTVAFCLMDVGWLELTNDDPIAAEQALQEGVERLERLGETIFLATTQAFLARALERQGRTEEANAAAAEAERNAGGRMVPPMVYALIVRAKVAARRGDALEAERLAREAATLAETTDFTHLRGEALENLAGILKAAGRSDDARSLLEQAVGLFDAKGAPVYARSARRDLEEALPPRGP
jgi:class 3 adenylate cyclase/tetratricopeptide (TPR) repeat protein